MSAGSMRRGGGFGIRRDDGRRRKLLQSVRRRCRCRGQYGEGVELRAVAARSAAPHIKAAAQNSVLMSTIRNEIRTKSWKKISKGLPKLLLSKTKKCKCIYLLCKIPFTNHPRANDEVTREAPQVHHISTIFSIEEKLFPFDISG